MSNLNLAHHTLATALSLSFCLTLRADEGWNDLIRLLPPSGNAVLAIDANALFGSALAKKHNWRESHASQFEITPTMLPPQADRFVLTSEVDIEHFEPKWEYAAMSVKLSPTMDELKTRTGGTADTLAGLPAVHTKRGSFIVPFSDNRIVLIRRAQRQWASQQLRLARERQSVAMSPLLKQTVKAVADGKWHVATAIQLEDAVPREEMLAAMKRSDIVSDSGATVEQLANEMATLKGLVLGVHVSDTIQGRLEMVFDQEPEGLSEVSKQFLLELLAGAGAMLPEFRDWQPFVGPKRCGIEGLMTTTGFRRVLSLVSVESVDVEPYAGERNTTSSTKRGGIKMGATKAYVRRIDRLVRDISSGAKASNLRGQLLWTDRCAKTISRLSTRKVDPSVAELGYEVSHDLMRIVSNFHYAADNVQSRSSETREPPIEWHTELVPYSRFRTPYGTFYRYAPFSYAQINIRRNVMRTRFIAAEELSNANAKATEILSKVEYKVAQMKQMITK